MGCKSELMPSTDLIRYDHLCWRLCIRILYTDWGWEVATCAEFSSSPFALINVWSNETIQMQLHSSYRNDPIYRKIEEEL